MTVAARGKLNLTFKFAGPTGAPAVRREAEESNGVVLTRLPGIHTDGHAPSLEAAKAEFQASWRQCWRGQSFSRGKHRFAAPGSRANIRPRMSDTQQEPDMTQRLTENWLVDWGLATIMGYTMPPRDPNDDDDDEGQDEEHEDEDEEDEDEHDEPAVIREPDDDE